MVITCVKKSTAKLFSNLIFIMEVLTCFFLQYKVLSFRDIFFLVIFFQRKHSVYVVILNLGR